MALLLAILSTQTPPASAKKRNRRNKNINAMKRECEKGDCAKEHEDLRENCVLRCQSAACYEEIYGAEELECVAAPMAGLPQPQRMLDAM